MVLTCALVISKGFDQKDFAKIRRPSVRLHVEKSDLSCTNFYKVKTANILNFIEQIHMHYISDNTYQPTMTRSREQSTGVLIIGACNASAIGSYTKTEDQGYAI